MWTAGPGAGGARQRRTRLALRHRLAAGVRCHTTEQVADALVAVHGTDPATVFLSVAARLVEPDLRAIDRALYEHGTLLRMHAMRRTVFVVPAELVPVVHWGASQAVAARERRLVLKLLESAGLDQRWLAEVADSTLAALEELGEAGGAELAEREPRLRAQVAVGPAGRPGSRFAVGTRLLTLLAMEGRIVRRRPRGGWTSSQFRWAVAPPMPPIPAPEARRELARRWLASYGPAGAGDLKWWTGWGVTEVREALASVKAVEVPLDGGPGFVLPGDDRPVDEPEPWAAFLPALDATPMGWQERSWYLPAEHAARLFDRSGNIGPTVWWDGRIVGGWAQRGGGEVVWRLLDDAGSEAAAAVEAAAGQLSSWLGRVVVTPRFRTPLERELSG